jgi:hypothetical protein
MRAAAALLVLACAPPRHWPARPADKPATRAELASYELTAPDPELARAMAGEGFKVVDHAPYQGQLEVSLSHEGDLAVATLRSDGFFVDEALGTDVAGLAHTLAVSARVAEFIRNSGLPQQHWNPGMWRID